MKRFATALALVLAFAANGDAMEVDLDLTQFTAVWSFDDANPLADLSGNGHTLIDPGGGNSPTIVTPPTSNNGWLPAGINGSSLAQPWIPPAGSGSYTPGPPGMSARFDGGDYFSIPNSAYSGGDFTAVIATRDTLSGGGFDTILASSRFRYQSINENVGGQINAPGGTFGGSTPIGVDDWHLIALRYDDTTRTLDTFNLTNTNVLGSPAMSGTANVPGLGNQLNFRLGGDGTSLIGGFDGFVGELDFVIFDNSALSDAQLQDVLGFFNFGSPQPPAALAPEPSSIVLMSAALAAMAFGYVRRRRAARC